MNWRVAARSPVTLGKLLAGVVLGLGVATVLSADPVVVPVVGHLPSYAVGGGGIVAAAGLVQAIDRMQFESDDCGCSGDCGCS